MPSKTPTNVANKSTKKTPASKSREVAKKVNASSDKKKTPASAAEKKADKKQVEKQTVKTPLQAIKTSEKKSAKPEKRSLPVEPEPEPKDITPKQPRKSAQSALAKIAETFAAKPRTATKSPLVKPETPTEAGKTPAEKTVKKLAIQADPKTPIENKADQATNSDNKAAINKEKPKAKSTQTPLAIEGPSTSSATPAGQKVNNDVDVNEGGDAEKNKTTPPQNNKKNQAKAKKSARFEEAEQPNSAKKAESNAQKINDAGAEKTDAKKAAELRKLN